jgi:hypothetical protein
MPTSVLSSAANLTSSLSEVKRTSGSHTSKVRERVSSSSARICLKALSILVDDAECDLNCRPVNQKYFARLREYAVDGTHCLKILNPPKNNASFDRGVCVEGKCKVSGLDKIAPVLLIHYRS